MNKKFLTSITLISFLCCTTAAYGYTFANKYVGDPSAYKWAGPIDANSSHATTFDPLNPPGTPGEATWSIVPAGFDVPFGDPALHPAGATSRSVVGMTGLPDVGGTPYEIWAIDWALNQWAAVSGFTNRGQVTDGTGAFNGIGGTVDTTPGGWNGPNALNANGGNKGDIRIAAYDMVPSFTAHSIPPGTETDQGAYENWGGDIHMGTGIGGFYDFWWVDDEFDISGDMVGGLFTYDFPTVMLHEVGHSLGLGHSDVTTSVMALYPDRGGALRTLTSDDIAGIQAIYAPGGGDTAPVPEPATMLLFGSGLLGMAGLRRKIFTKK